MRNIIYTIISTLFFLSIKAQVIITIAGTGIGGYSGDGGAAISATFKNPWGVCMDPVGNIYVADRNNFRIRKINSVGIITTIAGTGQPGHTGDGGLASSAMITDPNSIAIDAVGSLYFVTTDGYLRMIETSGIISTLAGNGSQGYSGDGGPAVNATFFWPNGVCVDASGNIYIADSQNNRIRKINSSGIISTIAGNGSSGYSGDGGPAINASLNQPRGVAADAIGNVYISDFSNNRIRKVDSNGIISTIAGTGSSGYSGDGGLAVSAKLFYPVAMAIDTAKNLFICEEGNNVIRKIDKSGIISTVAGNGTNGYTGDGGPPLNATLGNPVGIFIDTSNNVYIAETGNNIIRKIIKDSIAGMRNFFQLNRRLNLNPNPTTGILNIEIQNENSEIYITNVLSEKIFTAFQVAARTSVGEKLTIDLSLLQNGIYFVNLKTSEGLFTKKIVVQH